MNDNIIITQLKNENIILKKELEQNKNHIKQLDSTLLNIQTRYKELKSRYFSLLSKKEQYEQLDDILKKKDSLITELEKELNDIKIKYEKDKRIFNKNLEYIKEVENLKEKLKLNEDYSIKKANDAFYNHILQLEQTLKEFKKEEQEKLTQIEYEYAEKNNKQKRQMLKYIRKGQSKKLVEDEERAKVIDNISALNHNTLLNELEFESLRLEDLLKQRKYLDKTILQMKFDIETHKKIEKILVNKNRKYIDLIKNLSLRKRKGKISNRTIDDKSSDLSESIFFNKNNICQSIDKNEIEIIPIKKLKSLSMNTTFRENIKNRNTRNNNEKITLQKEIINKTKKIEDLRSQNEFYRTKLNVINQKYKNIILLFDEALGKIYENNTLENIKDIYIDCEEFKNCNFEQLSPEKKYIIVVLLIDYILPLINEETLNEKIKKTIKLFSENSYNFYNKTIKSNKSSKSNDTVKGVKSKILKDIDIFKKNNINCSFKNFFGNIPKIKIRGGTLYHDTIKKNYSS